MRGINFKIWVKKYSWVVALIGWFVLSTILIGLGAEWKKKNQDEKQRSAKQAVYDNMIEQIESANSEPVIVLGGKYRATRCEKPYAHCVKICKLMDIKGGKAK